MFNSLAAPSGQNIVDALGTGSTNTSIWLIGWGQNTCHGLFPKGSKAGLQVRDLGEVPLYDANNNVYQGYRTHFKWDCGLSVRDWRFVVRIANINVTAGAVMTANLVDTLITAVNKLPFVSAAGNSPPPGGTRPGQVNTVFYCNRTVRAALDAAQPGDELLLAPGATWNGTFTLTDKGSSTAWITVRTDVPGIVQFSRACAAARVCASMGASSRSTHR